MIKLLVIIFLSIPITHISCDGIKTHNEEPAIRKLKSSNKEMQFSDNEYKIACQAFDSLKQDNIEGFAKFCIEGFSHPELLQEMIVLLKKYEKPSKEYVKFKVEGARYSGKKVISRVYSFPFPPPPKKHSVIDVVFFSHDEESKIVGMFVTYYFNGEMSKDQ